MTTRRLAITLWAAAFLVAAAWWPLSYHYCAGSILSHTENTRSTPLRRSRGLVRRGERGVAVLSGMGKGIVYISWNSAFTRSGFFFEPVNPHEFPHPWLGFHHEGGRLWFSFPIGLVTGSIALAAAWHLASSRGRTHRVASSTEASG